MSKTPRAADLPVFSRPPVTEVVLGIQFATIESFQSVHVGLLWNEFKAKYPKVTEQPPLPQMFETFGVTRAREPQIRFEAFSSPQLPRYWFESATGEHMLQFQRDRLLHNWRQISGSEVYPLYEEIRDQFETELDQAAAFFDATGMGTIRPNQCEVTYINIIRLPDGANAHQTLERITPLWKPVRTEGALENVTLQSQSILPSGDEPMGRLYMKFDPVLLAVDFTPAIRLELTARGRPRDETVEGAIELLDQQRRTIVKNFAEVTSPEMQAFWERTDVG